MTQAHSNLSRWSRLSLRCAAAGVIISTVVAWSCGRQPNANLQMRIETVELCIPDRQWLVRCFSGRMDWYVASPYNTSHADLRQQAEWMPPWWVLRACDESPQTSVVYVFAFGWPSRCLWSAEYMSCQSGKAAPQFTRTRAIEVPLRPQTWFPTGVIPAGMVINTLVYSVSLYISTIGCSGYRKWTMRRLRRCGRCGYDLRSLIGSTCPECGQRMSHP